MNTKQETVVGRRSFLRRTAGITAGATALVATGLNTQTTHAAPAPNPAAIIEPIPGLSIELFDVTSGRTLGQFTSCTSIGTESPIMETRVIDSTGRTVIRKSPGRLLYLDVTLSSGVGNNSAIAAWRRLVEDGKMAEAAKVVQIIVRDYTNMPLFQWRLDRAWPAELVARSDEHLVESLTIVYEKLTRER